MRTDFDAAKAEAFSGRLLTALDNGALCSMVSVGHRTYLTRAGFRSISTHRLAHDIQDNWYIVRK
jgi:hypothetical protein